MKLLNKYNRLNITATILTFVIGSCTFYFLLNYILVRELDERLRTEQQEILAYAHAHNALPDIVRTTDQLTSFEPAPSTGETKFTTIKNTQNKASENLREIKFSVSCGSRNYWAIVAIPLDETEALLRIIIAVTIGMTALILLLGFMINRIVLRRLWQPFYETVAKVNTYDLASQEMLQLGLPDVEEFALLNRSINEMTGRIQADYRSLKNFTGQAAHEMQTPLAVIRTKLDTLMQHEATLAQNGQHIADIEKAVNRLSRLHGSLLLLTKVEHKQFKLNEEVNITAIIKEKWAEYEEMATAMQLAVLIELLPVTLKFHQQLAGIIIGNLLNNAIRYNRPGGNISIALQHNKLIVSNTSGSGHLDSSHLFKRFYRGGSAEEGTGLGLSIVKEICDLAGYSITYHYSEGWHNFTINFHPASDFLQS